MCTKIDILDFFHIFNNHLTLDYERGTKNIS
jgi:hypothetical protein